MFTPLLAVLLLAGLWSIYWAVAITYAKQSLARERSKLTERGLSLTCSDESWGGYPFRFEFTCTAPLLNAEGLGRIGTNRIMVMALAYNPKQIVILTDGPATEVKSPAGALSILHGRLLASITFDRDWNPALAAEITAVEIPDLLTARRVAFFTRPVPGELAGVAANVDGLHWQRPRRPELLIDAGKMTGALSPNLTLKVENIELLRGKVRYWGKGEIRLDDQRRPSGKLQTETNDLNGLLDILDPHLLMTSQEKANLRMVLGLLGQQAKADLVFGDGAFFIGPYRVSDIPPLY